MSSSFSRRRLLQAAGATAVASAAGSVIGSAPTLAAPIPARSDAGESTSPFDLGQVRLTASRFSSA